MACYLTGCNFMYVLVLWLPFLFKLFNRASYFVLEGQTAKIDTCKSVTLAPHLL